MNSLALFALACSLVGCAAEFPSVEPVAAPPAPAPTVDVRECAGSVETHLTGPVCLMARDENGPCFWRCQ